MEIVTEYMVGGKNVLGGQRYQKSEYSIDNGKAGTVHVTVLDPCITEEAQKLRAQALIAKCEELIRRGL